MGLQGSTAYHPEICTGFRDEYLWRAPFARTWTAVGGNGCQCFATAFSLLKLGGIETQSAPRL
jgi:hypothetical protein